jgi:hypothetical protein
MPRHGISDHFHRGKATSSSLYQCQSASLFEIRGRKSPPLKPKYSVIYASLFVDRSVTDEARSARKEERDVEPTHAQLSLNYQKNFKKNA